MRRAWGTSDAWGQISLLLVWQLLAVLSWLEELAWEWLGWRHTEHVRLSRREIHSRLGRHHPGLTKLPCAHRWGRPNTRWRHAHHSTHWSSISRERMHLVIHIAHRLLRVHLWRIHRLGVTGHLTLLRLDLRLDSALLFDNFFQELLKSLILDFARLKFVNERLQLDLYIAFTFLTHSVASNQLIDLLLISCVRFWVGLDFLLVGRWSCRLDQVDFNLLYHRLLLVAFKRRFFGRDWRRKLDGLLLWRLCHESLDDSRVPHLAAAQ